MNDDFDLKKRIADADPAKGFPTLNESVVAKAAAGHPKPSFSFKTARLALGSASLATAALVVSLTLPSALSPQPLFTMSTGSGQTSATSQESKVSADQGLDAMYWHGWISYEYVAGDELSDLGGSGEVYQGQLIEDPTSLLARLASIFQVSGSPVQDQWSTPEYPSYSITNGNTNLNTYYSGVGNWYYSNWNDRLYACEEVISEDGEATTPGCPEPKPTPELIPTTTELTNIVLSMSSQIGITADAASLTIYRDDWGAYASWPYVINGIDTGMQNYANWSSDGSLSYFSSYNFELISRGSFDTVSPRVAVSRISEGRWYGSPPESFYRDQQVFSNGLARSEGAVPAEEPVAADESSPAEDLPVEPEDQPMPVPAESQEPEIVRLTITSSEATMLSVWDAQGNYWLVPGYVLFNDQGWFDAVISLPDGLIELPEPMTIMPMDGIQEEPAVSEMVD
jgi:hypothetical protein